MGLTTGARLGPYEVVSPLGAGGMGEVYRARDTKLNRDVALKVLPDLFANDADRFARFTREAHTLAALNHPNIAHIHGLEESGGVRALVMELVDGEDLSALIARGPMPLADALPLARQIAEALEAAHEQGIVHRDLKPANIKVRADGAVKVLDFGLAKAFDPSAGAPIHGSTMTSPAMTQAGVILGTAAYMAPEQAKGKPADKRVDIWAFGCVVFEMLAGHRPFAGEDFTDTLTAIMRDAPSWDRLSKGTPPRLRELVARCLEKDPRKRLRDIGEARIVLEGDLQASPEQTGLQQSVLPFGRRWLRATLWTAMGAIGGAAAVWFSRPPVTEGPGAVRATISLPGASPLFRDLLNGIALSPDGRRLVYVSQQGITTALFSRDLAGSTASKLAGSDGGSRPFFSPDGASIGFFADGQLKRMPATGGTPVPIAPAVDPRGLVWTEDNWILFSDTASSGLSRVRVAGGAPEVLTTPDRKAGEKTHRFPEPLPGGRAVVFTVGAADLTQYSDARIVVRDLQTGLQHTLVEGGVNARYVPPGFLVYAKAGSLYAVAFDVATLEAKGAALEVQTGVSMTEVTGSADFATSDTGLLVYAPGGEYSTRFRLVWVDRQGLARPLLEQTSGSAAGLLSPDQQHLL